MNRTDRLYALVEELRAATRPLTAGALAARFEVAPRTIKRDISTLQQAGTAIWGTGGPGGGYALDSRATLPPLTFTAGEAVALAAALAVSPDLPFGPEGQTAARKLTEAMTPEGRSRAHDLAARVWVLPPDARRAPVARTLDTALAEQVVVVLDYVDAEGTRTEKRPVEPMAYAHRDGHWYLLAWCRRRRGGRWFRLDRIDGATLTTEPCPARELVEVFGPPPVAATSVAPG